MPERGQESQMERIVTSEGEGELNKASDVSQMLASKVDKYLRQAQGMSRHVDSHGLDKSQSPTVPCHRKFNREKRQTGKNLK